MRIVILEDNSDRRDAMSSVLADVVPNAVVEFFVTSQQMIDYLIATGIYDLALVSLDNDLDMIEAERGRFIDAGDGIAVAKWLTSQPPVVPVVVHTTNNHAGNQIEQLLEADGWIHARVVPYGSESWIQEQWRPIIRDLIVSYSPDATVSFTGTQILKHALKKGIAADQSLREILRVASLYTRGNGTEDDLCFELALLGEGFELKSTIGTGFPVLSEISLGATTEVAEWSAESFGIGPIAASHESLEPMFRNLLRELGVREIQFDVVQPDPEHQAVLLTANRSAQLDLCSHRVQANIREMKALLELGLIVTLKESQSQSQADLGARTMDS